MQQIINFCYLSKNIINQDDIINYIKYNNTYLENKDNQYYYVYNNIDYLVDIKLIPKTDDQLFTEINEWFVNEKPYLEYDKDNNLFTKEI